ncbi:MAG: MarR family transcriptional regulator [Deltaproteobacteria bacterium]|nr:MarR family transcriptional regulator [Deltaproteobacteria bacterium]MCB9489676.1 MarR family transcriptional regulator [Deltaproteobacteria bacterium]
MKKSDVPALYDVLYDVRSLMHRMMDVTERMHGEGRFSPGRRGVMNDLLQNGPQTVPAMARKRPVSRQHIEFLVKQLLRAGYVEERPNPAHKRSRLIALTETGERRIKDILAREMAAFPQLKLEATRAELEQTSDVLRRLVKSFEDERWLKKITREATHDDSDAR